MSIVDGHISHLTTINKHHGPFKPHHHPWYIVAADAEHDGTQHPAHSGELGVDLRFAVRRLERLHSPCAGLSVVPAIPAIPAARTGEQRQ